MKQIRQLNAVLTIQSKVQETACPFLPFPSHQSWHTESIVDITRAHCITKIIWRTSKNSTIVKLSIGDEKWRREEFSGMDRQDLLYYWTCLNLTFCDCIGFFSMLDFIKLLLTLTTRIFGIYNHSHKLTSESTLSLFLPFLVSVEPCFCCSSFFWARIIARLARGRISRTCLGGMIKDSRGLSPNGCSLPANILSLRSLSYIEEDNNVRIILISTFHLLRKAVHDPPLESHQFIPTVNN